MARRRPHLNGSLPRPSGSGALPTLDADGQPLLRLQTLGAATILIGDTRMQASAGTMFSLLLRVAYAPGMVVDRDDLVASLWPEYEDLRRRANLRQALYKLRNAGVRIAMNGNVVQADETQFVRTFSLVRSTDAFDRDVTLGHEPFGVFLPGLVVPWEPFQVWLDEQREAIHSDVRRVLVEQLRRRRDRADWGGAEALARNLLQFDSLNEEATLTIAECTALSGSKAEAIAILDRYLAELGSLAGEIRLPATLLRRRIAEPSPRTRLSFAPTERHFVGRDAELAELTLAMRRARWHDGNAVLLHGAAGIGKSRLAHELSKVAEIEGVRVVQASCREGDLERTLSLFLELVPELLGLSGALGCAPDSMAALRRLVPQDRVASSGDGTAPLPPREPMPPALTLRRAIVDLLSAVSDEKPMLLIVEDVHWIDEHSWEVLTDLVDRLSSMRVFVLLTSREPHARPHRPQRVSPALMVKRVPTLSAEHCVQLSRAIGDDLSAPVTEELSEWFVRACEGNPLFLRSLVNHWIETGEAGGVPPTLHGVIELRLSQLSGEALRVLQTATLLEKWATVERVVRVLELRANEMLQSIEQLEAMGALRANAGSLLVAHELVGRAARARMSELGLRVMHRRLAEALLTEARLHNDLDMLLSGLDHSFLTGEAELVSRETMQSIDSLVSLDAVGRGLIAIRRIDRMLLSRAEQSRIAEACARLLGSAGEWRKALEESPETDGLPAVNAFLSDEAANFALTFSESAYRADSEVNRSELLMFVLKVAELSHLALETRRRAVFIGLRTASNECDPVLSARLFSAAQIADRELISDEACRRIAVLYYTHHGDCEVARAIAIELYESAARHPDIETSYHDCLTAGFSLRIVGDDRTHIDALTLAFDIAVRTSMPINAQNAAYHLCQCFLEIGDLVAVHKWLREALRLYDSINDPPLCNYVRALECRVAIEEGRVTDAQRALAEFSARLPKYQSRRSKMYERCLEISTLLLDSQWCPSSQQTQELHADFTACASLGTVDFLASTLVLSELRAGRVDVAEHVFTNFVVLRRERRELSAILLRSEQALIEHRRRMPCPTPEPTEFEIQRSISKDGHHAQ